MSSVCFVYKCVVCIFCVVAYGVRGRGRINVVNVAELPMPLRPGSGHRSTVCLPGVSQRDGRGKADPGVFRNSVPR